MLRNKTLGSRAFNLGFNGIFLVVILVIMVPIFFMLTASLMPSSEIFSMPYRWIPKSIYWKNYTTAIAGNDRSFVFVRNVINSVIVASGTTVFSVLVSGFAGYGLSKYKFRGRNLVFLMIMGRMMIPFEAIMIPMYISAVKLGLQNTYTGLMLPFILHTFGLFQMRQYLMTFPDDILDAGRIDGLGELGIFWRLVFKNSTPAIATAAILCFRGQWDNLLWPLLIAQKEAMKTIPTYIVKFTEEKSSDEGAMMAVAVLASIPIIMLFLTLSKYFLGGSAMYSAGKE
jgi:multiple sugar transport system permease protein